MSGIVERNQRESKNMSTSNENVNVLKHLVVDSGAIIKEVNMMGLAENLWTVSDVLEEIRDKRARHVLQNLPKELKVREPSAASIATVVEFAKKTGDLRSLSTADLRVLALTYMLEVEIKGSSDHLRKEPVRAGTAVQFKNGKFSKLVEDKEEKLQKKKIESNNQRKQERKESLDLIQGLTVIVRGLNSSRASPRVPERHWDAPCDVYPLGYMGPKMGYTGPS